MITTLIFDLDGLLADTEKIHFQSYCEVLQKYAIKIEPSFYGKHWIQDGKGISEFILENNLKLDAETIRNEKRKRYQELISIEVEPMPGALELLESIRITKELALATSSYAVSANKVLRKLKIENYFTLIATRESVSYPKPSPEIFLYVAEKLNVHPDECLVLEDAEKGVIAAHKAGMKSIAIPNIFTMQNNFSKATKVLTSLKEVNTDLINEF